MTPTKRPAYSYAAPIAGAILTVVVLTLFAGAILTGGGAIPVHVEDYGVRRVVVCPDAAGYLEDVDRAEQEWAARGCPSFPVDVEECTEDQRDGVVYVALCGARKPCRIGYAGQTEVREGGAGLVVLSVGAEYGDVRHELGHLRTGGGVDGHSSQAGGWMSAVQGPEFVGIDCGGAE